MQIGAQFPIMKSIKRGFALRRSGGFLSHMRKFLAVLLSSAAILLLLSGCKTESTTILNTNYKIFYGGSQIETTVRELKVDGGTTTARIRFTNLGSEELDSIEAQVEFIDASGDTVATYIINDTFSEPVEVGASFSETAECDSDSSITGVYVTEYVPQS